MQAHSAHPHVSAAEAGLAAVHTIARAQWQQKEREYHYVAVDLLAILHQKGWRDQTDKKVLFKLYLAHAHN
jgi:hypothetical protein